MRSFGRGSDAPSSDVVLELRYDNDTSSCFVFSNDGNDETNSAVVQQEESKAERITTTKRMGVNGWLELWVAPSGFNQMDVVTEAVDETCLGRRSTLTYKKSLGATLSLCLQNGEAFGEKIIWETGLLASLYNGRW